jgi:hypothetical protein
MSGETVAILVLIGVILFQEWMHYSQSKNDEARISNLLDRVMATDYAQYVQGEVAKEQVKRPLTPEEIFEMQQERGIPV